MRDAQQDTSDQLAINVPLPQIMSNGSDQHAGPLPIPEIADGRYETKRVLGAGSYGTVVLAADRENKGELVAIKYLECNGLRQPGNERLAHREIVNHSSLAHPHVRFCASEPTLVVTARRLKTFQYVDHHSLGVPTCMT